MSTDRRLESFGSREAYVSYLQDARHVSFCSPSERAYLYLAAYGQSVAIRGVRDEKRVVSHKVHELEFRRGPSRSSSLDCRWY